MSDLHAWPPQSAVDAAFELFAEHRDYVRDLVHRHPGDEYEPLRSMWLAEVFALDILEDGMRRRLAGPVPVGVGQPRWPVGEDTDAWLAGKLPCMPRNRGPQ
jgi:hypothetical protein